MNALKTIFALMLAAVMPEITRPTNSQPSVGASAIRI